MLIRNPGQKSNGCAHRGQPPPPFSHSSKTNSRPLCQGTLPSKEQFRNWVRKGLQGTASTLTRPVGILGQVGGLTDSGENPHWGLQGKGYLTLSKGLPLS